MLEHRFFNKLLGIPPEMGAAKDSQEALVAG